jgi:archaellum biogenesis ATPase FlaH
LIKKSFRELKDHRTLIVGDVGTGKTVMTRNILMDAHEDRETITILDFAPRRKEVEGFNVGGYLLENSQGVRCLFSEEINTPRLSARNPVELVRLADENRVITSRLIKEYIMTPNPILFVNDISIHLQRGDISQILEAIEYAQTMIANGYFGKHLSEDYGSGVSEHERKNMIALAEQMDFVINLNEE